MISQENQIKFLIMWPTTVILKFFSAFALFVWLIFGIHGIFTSIEENKCEMTYMFEYPQYIKIDFDLQTKEKFPKYNLYVYGEGNLAERYHQAHFNGIPVLFIPGNAGSYKQVRSLASVAYRKALDARKRFHFDFFTIDFNEELSALYGGVLEDQASYAVKCIQQILQLYNSGREKPKSLVLIGHSMGGIIAKAVFANEDFDPSTVETIISLATPHRSPVLVLDEHLKNFYQKINSLWAESNSTQHVAIASIGGGNRDIQVRSGLTSSMDESSINVLTTEIPGVWLNVDHLCMAWCKQVILTVVRSLFDMVDPTIQQFKRDRDERNEILYYHLVKRFAGKRFTSCKPPPVVSFDPDGKWREVVSKRLTLNFENEAKGTNTYLMVPLVDNPYRDRLAVIVANLGIRHWIFGCVASSWHKGVRFCEKGVDLSHQTLLLPPTGDDIKRKAIHLDLAQLKLDGFTHVVINVPKNQGKAIVQWDVHRTSDRDLNFNINPWAMSSINLSIPADMLVYNLTLPDLNSAWQSLRLKFDSNCPMESHGLIRKVVPWSHEGEFFLTNQSVTIQLYSPKSPMVSEYQSAHLQLLNFHSCNYNIQISTSWRGIASQLIRFYAPGIVSLIAAIFVDCFAQQLAAKSKQLPVPSTLRCLLEISVLKTALVPEGIATLIGFIETWHFHWWPLPHTDDSILHAEGLDIPLIYLLLGSMAWIAAIMLSVVFHLAILAGGTAMHSFVIRYLRAGFGISAVVAELVTFSVSRIPVAVSVLLVALAISTSGSIALLLGSLFCVWKMFGYYEDQLEVAVTGKDSGDDDANTRRHDDSFSLNTTISLLWICTTLLCLPSLIVWSKNPSVALANDPSLTISIVWSVFGMIVWQKCHASRDGIISYGLLSVFVSILSISVSIYGLFSIYRVKYFLTVVIVLYAVKLLV